MADYLKKRFKKLKDDWDNGIVLLMDNFGRLWTYDDDAISLAETLGRVVQYNSKEEALLKVNEEDLEDYDLEEIWDEDGAFFLEYESELESETLPPSALMKVELLSESGRQTVIIVSDLGEQDTSKGIYGEWRGISKCILQADDSGASSFTFKDVDYTIDSALYTPRYETLLSHRHYFLNAESGPQTLFVYKNKSYSDEHKLEAVPAQFYPLGSNSPQEMDVFYSVEDGAYYVFHESFTKFRKKHGMPPFVSLSNAPGEGFSSDPDIAEESILHLYGYNVSQEEGLSDTTRQDLLTNLVKYGIFSREKIRNHLFVLILKGENTPAQVKAVTKWRKDLTFISSYNMMD